MKKAKAQSGRGLMTVTEVLNGKEKELDLLPFDFGDTKTETVVLRNCKKCKTSKMTNAVLNAAIVGGCLTLTLQAIYLF